MQYKPRDPNKPVLSISHWFAIAGYGALITCSVLASFAGAIFLLGYSSSQAVTVSFLTLAFAQLWHIFNMRQAGSSVLRNEITSNGFVWGALLLCTGLLLTAVYVPVISRVLKITTPAIGAWLLILPMSLVPLAAGQVIKTIRHRQGT